MTGANLPEVSTTALSPTAQAGPLTHYVSTQICVEKCLRRKGLQALVQSGVSASSATPAPRSVPLWKDFLKQKKEHRGSALGAVVALAEVDEVSQ